MKITKNKQFTAQQNNLANLAKALAHPARIAILDHLLKVDACICRDIVDEIPLAQSTISQHLKVLKNAGLIQGNIEGNAICYCIDAKSFELLQNYLNLIQNKTKVEESTCC